MESNQEEPKVYRPRTGSLERKKAASDDTRSAAAPPTDGDEPKPRERKNDDEQPANRTAARQSFFKDRAPQREAHNDDGYSDRPRRAARTAPRGEDEKPRRRAADRETGERRQKSPGFDKFYREKPRSDRRSYDRDRDADRDRDRADEGRPYARKPYGEKESRGGYRSAKAYDDRGEKPRREKSFGDRRGYGDDRSEKPRRGKPFGDRRGYDDDRSEKPYARKPYGEKEAYASRSDRPRAERKPFKEIQVKEPNMPVRLNKFIANSGVCSRREADEYIQKGEITVNGEVITTLGTKVLPTDEICWNGDKLSGEKKVYVLLNKPKGYVTTVEDPHADKTVMDLIAGACSERVYPVGRLDKNTTGVLLFTNDGELTKTLTHPGYNKRKVYQVTLDKTLKKPDMEQLVEGVELEDGLAVADEVGYTNMEDKAEVGLEIHSGRNRVVRRMFEALGYEVKKLDRVYFAGLTKKSLERGQWRILSPKEVSMLKMGAYE
jgi:23S rRNA pseudouridine2605 synthase